MGSTEVPSPLLRDAARELAALRDPDLALGGLVRRLRAAVDCDLAYLSLNDPATRHTEIRYSDGIRTTEYRSIRMPIGTGVLGMAAAGVASESADYLRDVGRLHVPAVDEAVAAEGVAAILSTPLRSGDEVVGALTIANRRAGAFGAEQRTALDDAALVGSIAVELYTLRVRLEQEITGGAERTEQLALAQALAQSLAEGGGSEELLSIASEAAEGEVVIDDIESDAVDPAAPRVALDSGGALRVTTSRADSAAPILSTIGTYLSIALLYESAVEDARHLRESELVERLIDRRAHHAGPTPRTGLAGDGPYVVQVLRVVDPHARRMLLSATRRDAGASALVSDYRGQIVVIGRQDPALAARREPHPGRVTFYGGCSVATTESGIPHAYEESARVAASMQTLRRPGEMASRAQLGVVAFALGDDSESAERLVTSYLEPLLGGTARDHRLLRTALRYLDSQGSVARTAAELGVHENTVRQRLERLDSRLPGWRDGVRTLDVHVALRTHALLSRDSRPARDTAS